MEKIISSVISNRVLELFNASSSLPDSVFKNKEWSTRVFYNFPFFWDEKGSSLNLFLNYLRKHKSRYLFLHGDSRVKSVTDKGNGEYTSLKFATNDLTSSEYVRGIGDDPIYNLVNWYIYSETGDWGFYADTGLALSVFACSPNIEPEMLVALAQEELVSNEESLRELYSNANVKEVYIEGLIRDFMSNYSLKSLK